MKLVYAIVGLLMSVSAFATNIPSNAKVCVVTQDLRAMHVSCDGKQITSTVDTTLIDDNMLSAQFAEMVNLGFGMRTCIGQDNSVTMRCIFTR